jgi:hypothetical protein
VACPPIKAQLRRLLKQASPAQLREVREIALDHFISCHELGVEVEKPQQVVLEALRDVVLREKRVDKSQVRELERLERERRDYSAVYSGGFGTGDRP